MAVTCSVLLYIVMCVIMYCYGSGFDTLILTLSPSLPLHLFALMCHYAHQMLRAVQCQKCASMSIFPAVFLLSAFRFPWIMAVPGWWFTVVPLLWSSSTLHVTVVITSDTFIIIIIIIIIIIF